MGVFADDNAIIFFVIWLQVGFQKKKYLVVNRSREKKIFDSKSKKNYLAVNSGESCLWFGTNLFRYDFINKTSIATIVNSVIKKNHDFNAKKFVGSDEYLA